MKDIHGHITRQQLTEALIQEPTRERQAVRLGLYSGERASSVRRLLRQHGIDPTCNPVEPRQA